MKLDRKLQFEILEKLFETYGEPLDSIYSLFPDVDEEVIHANLRYLIEEELVKAQEVTFVGGGRLYHSIELSRDGVNLICKDGSIRGKLDDVTIRFSHDDLLKVLEMVLKPVLDKQQPGYFESVIRGASVESLKLLVLKLLGMAATKLDPMTIISLMQISQG